MMGQRNDNLYPMLFDTDHENIKWSEYDCLSLKVQQDSGEWFNIKDYREPAKLSKDVP